MDLLSEIIGTILQILLFSFIPFLVFVIKKRTAKGFFEYIGLKKSTSKANYLAIAVCLLFALPPLLLTILSEDFKQIMFDPNSVTGTFRQMGVGIDSMVILVVMAVFKTSFAEEIFFRGFLAKRLIGLTGYFKGNVIQAILFGGLHTALFTLTTTNLAFLTVIFLIPAGGAYASVYLNEKVANGSIIPGWISHGLANVLAFSIVGFVLYQV